MTVPPAEAQAGCAGRDTLLQRVAAVLEVEQPLSHGVLAVYLVSVLRAGQDVVGSETADGPGQRSRLPDGTLPEFFADDANRVFFDVLFGCHSDSPFKVSLSR